MENHYKEIDGELLTETCAEHQLMEEGKVVGVSCSTTDGILNIRARAVVMATDGYGASVELRAPSLTTSDGIYIGREIGVKSTTCST